MVFDDGDCHSVDSLQGSDQALEWAHRVAAEAERARSGEIKTRSLDELVAELGFDPDETADQVCARLCSQNLDW